MRRRRLIGRLGTLALAGAGAALAGSVQSAPFVAGSARPAPSVAGSAQSAPVTFSRDVAPILYANCVGCHRPGGTAPFSLLTYDDARPLAERIAESTARGTMPPWLPERGVARYAGERGLDDEERAILRRWAEEGAPRGDPSDLPPTPTFHRGWTLGEPDLIVELPAYTPPAAGPDVYRNLVAPIPVSGPRWVEAVELIPGDPRIVHHARMMVDTTASSREADARDPGPGFDGMDASTGAVNPDGFFVGWTPGRLARPAPEGLAWRLEPGTDVVLQIHVRPGTHGAVPPAPDRGSADPVRPRIGFHFTQGPPSRRPALIMLGSRTIDIPAGDSARVVEDCYRLPVDVEALGVYPHGHFLLRRVEAFAALPGGRTRWLLRIPEWDFAWQDEYFFAKPLPLPKGSVLTMRYTYDNSSSNPRNPNDPPRRVRYGPRSSDEMADLVVQVLPRSAADRDVLVAEMAREVRTMEMDGAAFRERVIADSLLEAGELEGALARYRAALTYRADRPEVLDAIARILLRQGEVASARLVAERAASLVAGPDPRLLATLAEIHAEEGEPEAAAKTAKRALDIAEARGDRALAARLRDAIARYRALKGER